MKKVPNSSDKSPPSVQIETKCEKGLKQVARNFALLSNVTQEDRKKDASKPLYLTRYEWRTQEIGPAQTTGIELVQRDERKAQSIFKMANISTLGLPSFWTKDTNASKNLEAHLWLGPACPVLIGTQNCVAYDSFLFGYLCDLCSVRELYENKG